jgi:flagellar motor switch protein FliM
LPNTTVQFMGAALRHTTAVVAGVAADFTLRMPEASGLVQLFYSFEGVVEQLVASAGDAEEGAEASHGPVRLDWSSMAPVRVAVRARLRPTSIQIRDLTALCVGDVVHLDQPIDQEVDLLIGRQLVFRGHPGRVDEALGVQITRGA